MNLCICTGQSQVWWHRKNGASFPPNGLQIFYDDNEDVLYTELSRVLSLSLRENRILCAPNATRMANRTPYTFYRLDLRRLMGGPPRVIHIHSPRPRHLAASHFQPCGDTGISDILCILQEYIQESQPEELRRNREPLNVYMSMSMGRMSPVLCSFTQSSLSLAGSTFCSSWSTGSTVLWLNMSVSWRSCVY